MESKKIYKKDLNIDGSLVPCFGDNIARIIALSGEDDGGQLVELLGLISDIAQAYFHDYNSEITMLERELHYQSIKCEEVSAYLQDAFQGREEASLPEVYLKNLE